PAVRRIARRRSLHDCAGLSVRHQSGLLGILDRRLPRADRTVREGRHPRRPGNAPQPVLPEEIMTTPTLRTQDLSKQWGAFKANSDVSLTFAPGARHALIGPNGAGKTTFINLLTGALVPTSGDVFLGDENITSLPQHQRVKRGMTRTFQINTLFPGLTVMESVVLAICEREGRGSVWHQTVAKQRAAADEAAILLEQLRLYADRNALTRNL